MSEAVDDFVEMGAEVKRINKVIDKTRKEVMTLIDNLKELEQERKRIIDIYLSDKE